ncbi:MAG: hypothetical protein D6681_00245 [Calditrichaeota bacterium]|nr:MAG: hypothetical protein D6681_00245 [Calditrichota bacterium]
MEKAREVLRETTETIGAGAKVVGEKAGQLAGQVLGFLKKGVAEAAKVGGKVVEEISHTAATYAEKYKHMAEMRKLNHRKRELFQELGKTLYEQAGNDPAALGKVLEQEKVQNLLRDLETLDRQIVELGKQLDTGSTEKTE